jgi:hypothetical protein
MHRDCLRTPHYSWTLGPSFSARTEFFRLAPSLTRPATDSGPSRVVILGPQRPRVEPGSARSTRLARVLLFARDELRRCARYGPVLSHPAGRPAGVSYLTPVVFVTGLTRTLVMLRSKLGRPKFILIFAHFGILF